MNQSEERIKEESMTAEEFVKPVKEPRIVLMEDGTTVNFGIRANVISAYDTEEKLITFKVITGDIIAWPITDIDNLTEAQVTVYLYGLLSKVKTNLAPVKVPDLAKVIRDNIATINSGRFLVRGAGVDEDFELSLNQQAYALVLIKYQNKVEWSNLSDPAVIVAIQTIWDSKSTSEKNTIRKNPYFKLEKATLEQAKYGNFVNI